MRRRNLMFSFGISAAFPFAVTGLVLAERAPVSIVAVSLAALYVGLLPLVAAVVISLHRHALEHERLANHDELTGLPNRAQFRRRVEAALGDGRPLTVLVADVDLFKGVNDRFGHVAADELLIAIARRLAGTVRTSDTVARLGGDEFGLILPGAAPETAAQVARRIVDSFEAPLLVDELMAPVAVSLGLACSPEHGADFEILVQRADFAMYAAKDAGGHCFRIAEPASNMLKGPGQAIGALQPVRRVAPANGG